MLTLIMETTSKGPLLIIGGGEDKHGECVILRHAWHLFGEREARVVVLATASAEGEEAGEVYRDIFSDFGVALVEALPVATRKQAESHTTVEAIDAATGIFFTGGDQLRITSTLGGTAVLRALHRARSSGAVVAGTSAGASVMSATMIVDGPGDASASRNIHMSPGIGLFDHAVIDQHFAQRGRINRLLAAVSQNPALLGIGIDEDTAITLSPDGIFTVIGSQTVTVIDGSRVSYTNVSELGAREPLTLGDVVLHVLSDGHRYDCTAKRPLLPVG